MKGHVSTTIPQRQYENLKITYYFENESERQVAIDSAITDCKQYKNCVKDVVEKPQPKHNLAMGVTEEFTCGELQFRKLRGEWQYWNKKKGAWITEDTPDTESTNKMP